MPPPVDPDRQLVTWSSGPDRRTRLSTAAAPADPADVTVERQPDRPGAAGSHTAAAASAPARTCGMGDRWAWAITWSDTTMQRRWPPIRTSLRVAGLTVAGGLVGVGAAVVGATVGPGAPRRVPTLEPP